VPYEGMSALRSSKGSVTLQARRMTACRNVERVQVTPRVTARRVTSLRDSGVLSDEEFVAAKRQLLGSSGRGADNESPDPNATP
jgi:hypothetical protein